MTNAVRPPETEGAATPDGERAATPDGERAATPDGERAATPDGERTSARDDDGPDAPGDARVDYSVAFTANGEMEAHAVRSALEAAGIPARLKMEAAQKLFAVTVDGLGAVKVLVPTDRLEEARDVLENPATPLEEQPLSE